jgi:hypothetical protein
LKQLRVKSAFLTDSFGRPIDGNHDGQPGGDFSANLSKNKVTILAVPQAQAVSSRTAAAVDAVLRDMGVPAKPVARWRR